MKKPFVVLVLLTALLSSPLSAQDLLGDAGQFVRENHLHQISGFTTLALAGTTGALGVSMISGLLDRDTGAGIHGALAAGTILAGATTLGLGLTAYSQRLEKVWPHVALVGLAEVGWIVNATLLTPGSTEHQITGALSISSLVAGVVAIILLTQ